MKLNCKAAFSERSACCRSETATEEQLTSGSILNRFQLELDAIIDVFCTGPKVSPAYSCWAKKTGTKSWSIIRKQRRLWPAKPSQLEYEILELTSDTELDWFRLLLQKGMKQEKAHSLQGKILPIIGSRPATPKLVKTVLQVDRHIVQNHSLGSEQWFFFFNLYLCWLLFTLKLNIFHRKNRNFDKFLPSKRNFDKFWSYKTKILTNFGLIMNFLTNFAFKPNSDLVKTQIFTIFDLQKLKLNKFQLSKLRFWPILA